MKPVKYLSPYNTIETSNVGKIDTNKTEVNKIVNQYPQHLSWRGDSKGLRDSVPPVVSWARLITYHLHKHFDKNITQMEDAGAIEQH